MNAGAARVLALLRGASGAASGEALSAELGVSRAQVWKHIESLRRLGYDVEGEPGGGYRLRAAPDRLYGEEILCGLDTRWLAREIEHFEEIDSTNRVATERAAAGAAAGYTVVAEAQTAGRGRLGRRFFSPPHANLYTSIVLRPRLELAQAPTLIPTAAIAVADAIAAELGRRDDVEIKWPNDVLVGGLKTSGILMELQAEATRIGHAILGIGVNLNVDRADFPDEFRSLATSLRSFTGRRIDRIGFARRLYSILEAVLDEHARDGFPPLRARYEAYFAMAGRRVRVLDARPDGAGDAQSGVVVGIDDEGALWIETEDGGRTRVIAGDVTLAKESDAS
ncbi:MAG: biotin--[acetyl-CoA-carboxylase] ligase [Myxococcales bacterium]|nr:biotin--[acetyl-CoA-carboxylase] ligase [Myxococcales bacterium]